MPNVIDFSWARPDPQAVKDAEFDGIVGYVGLDNTGKLLQKEWFDLYVAAGLSVTLVWELGPQRALAGYSAGKADALEAARQAKALGYDGCIYFVLEDPRKLPTSSWPAVIAYARGLNDAGIDNEIGGYGSKALLNNVANNLGLIELQWYVGPWGNDWDGADMVQTYRTDMPEIAGTPRNQYDEDFCPNDDWGQHPRPDQPTPQPVPLPEEDMDWIYVRRNKAGVLNPVFAIMGTGEVFVVITFASFEDFRGYFGGKNKTPASNGKSVLDVTDTGHTTRPVILTDDVGANYFYKLPPA